jgi:uncharacterized repeat protein (TIGR03803 family)
MPLFKSSQVAKLFLAAALAFPAAAHAGTFQTIYTFGNGSNDGVSPMSALIAKNGVLYGTTFRGGPSGDGTVYSFDVATSTETVVTTAMGTFPFAPVVYHKNTLFGTTAAADNGQGNIYSVNLKTGSVANLYTFGRGESQASPGALVEIGGKLYGTTFNAGNYNDGSVFAFDPASLTYTTLYSFTAGNDGKNPQGLIVNGGLLYGVAIAAGANGHGTIFSVDPNSGAEATIYSFQGATDGAGPSGIVFHKGTIYGTASFGGANNDGTLFALNPGTGQLSLLFSFPGSAGGCTPGGQPTVDHSRIYGITGSCGDQANQGILYDLSLKNGKEQILHTFSNGPDGVSPEAGLLLSNGVLYGTTSEGGTNNAGTIFSYTP